MINRPITFLYYIIILIIGLSLISPVLSPAQENAGESIFKYKKELSITDKQERNLRDILVKFQDYLRF